jgi:hypothetical protein
MILGLARWLSASRRPRQWTCVVGPGCLQWRRRANSGHTPDPRADRLSPADPAPSAESPGGFTLSHRGDSPPAWGAPVPHPPGPRTPRCRPEKGTGPAASTRAPTAPTPPGSSFAPSTGVRSYVSVLTTTIHLSISFDHKIQTFRALEWSEPIESWPQTLASWWRPRRGRCYSIQSHWRTAHRCGVRGWPMAAISKA